MVRLPPPPPTVADLTAACVRAVDAAVGVRLDGTQDTLPILDHYVSLVPEGTSTPAEVLGLIAPMIGAYFGEVVRHHLPGSRWHAPPEAPEQWRIEMETCFLCFNPVAMALEAILHEPQDGWSASLSMLDRDRPAVEAAVERLGAVTEEDYYRLSVRYEVIDTAHQVLTTRTGQRRELFGPDAYEAAVTGTTSKLPS